MPRIRKEDSYDRKYHGPEKNRLTETQLTELEKELAGYRKGENKTIDDRAWMQSRGAMKEGRVVGRDFTGAEYFPGGACKKSSDCEPILFEQLSEDLEQYYKWKGRKEFGQKKRLEDYSKVAERMNV